MEDAAAAARRGMPSPTTRRPNLLFIGIGNGGAVARGDSRSGRQGRSPVPLLDRRAEADTGEYVWHYQQVAERDSWDYTAVQQITVADLEIDGKKRHVIMQAPKNGYFYVLDATSGELLSAKPIVPAQLVDRHRHEDRPADHESGSALRRDGQGLHCRAALRRRAQLASDVVQPADRARVHPDDGGELSLRRRDARTTTRWGRSSRSASREAQRCCDDPKALRVNKGYLLAWDPVKQKEVWRVSHGNGRGGGTLDDGGHLVFQGNSKNQEFAAYRADNGREAVGHARRRPACSRARRRSKSTASSTSRWSPAPGSGGNYWAPNYSRMLVFKLGGTATLPDAGASSSAGAESAASVRHGRDDRARRRYV